MFPSLRKSAFVAGHLLSVAALLRFYASPRLFATNPLSVLGGILRVFGIVLFALPFPALLLTVSIAAVPLTLPRTLRKLTPALIAVQALAIVTPNLVSFIQSIVQAYRLSNIQVFAGPPLASQLGHWLFFHWDRSVLERAWFLIAQIALLLFLAQLFRQPAQERLANPSSPEFFRVASIIALWMSCASAILEIAAGGGAYVEALARSSELPGFAIPSRGELALHIALSVLPRLLNVAVAWILAKSIPHRSRQLRTQTS